MTEKFCIRCALDTLYTYTDWGGSRLGGSHLHHTNKTFIKTELAEVYVGASHYGVVDIYECPQCHMRYEFGVSQI